MIRFRVREQALLVASTVAVLTAGSAVAAHAAAPIFPSLAASYDNVGITADDDTAPGNFDGGGASFSATALTNAGAAPGASIKSAGETFTFPGVPAGTSDNTVAQGQRISVSGARTLGFLLSASYGPATGTGMITYTDGSTQSYTLNSPDWFSSTPPADGTLAVNSAYQNRLGNTTYPYSANIFAETVSLTPGKTLASVTLPDGGPLTDGIPALHIFALATGGGAVQVSSPGNQTSSAGVAVKLQIHASDTASGQTLSYAASGLPPGLSINAHTGLISGTPAQPGTSTVTVTVTAGVIGSATFTWTVVNFSCKVVYKEYSALDYYFADTIDIYNTGHSTIHNWVLRFTFRGGEQVDTDEDANFTQSGETVTLTPTSSNATINPGAHIRIAPGGHTDSVFGKPNAFTLNGAPCST